MADEPGTSGRVIRALAAGLSGLALAEIMTAIACGLAGGISLVGAVDSFTLTDGITGLALSACGVMLAWHRPRNPIGWLFLAGGVVYATSAAAMNLLGFGAAAGWNTLVLRLLASLFMLAWPWAIGLCLPLALLLFPDGRPAGRRWHWLIWVIPAAGVLFELSFAVTAMPHTACGRSGRIWPPAAGTFARITDGHPGPPATSRPVTARRADGRHRAISIASSTLSYGRG
jgi:two-component system, NarL family, sensor kinase